MQAPSYRERLSAEGAVLAASGLVGSALLLAFVDQSRDAPQSTIVQLVAVAVLCLALGSYFAKKWMEDAQPVDHAEASGEPTPLWQLPLITGGLALVVALPPPHLWDAALRVTGGCLLVGLMQAGVMARLVAADERRRGRRYVRRPGSRILRGTKLGYFSDVSEPQPDAARSAAR